MLNALNSTAWYYFRELTWWHWYYVYDVTNKTYLWIYIHMLSKKAMACHSSTLGWKIPWTEEPGRLQSMGSLGVGHDWATHFHFSLSCTGEGNGNPFWCSCLENPRDGGACWAAISGVTQSRTRLKWLSSSSSSNLINLCLSFLVWNMRSKSIFPPCF